MKKLRNELTKKYNECLEAKIYISWRQFLETSYETASERKQYNRCYLIQDLIIEDINS